MDLPTPKEMKSFFPLTNVEGFVAQSRKVARDLLLGKEKRTVIIAGPCSIHDISSALDYAMRFRKLAKEVEKTCYLIMRVYVQKPRTVTGWKGLFYDPHLDGSNDMRTGIYLSRQLLLELAKLGIPTATEFLDPLTAPYVEDLVTWGFIGARTSASQPHRELASYLPMPIGFKNGTDGNVDQAINGVISASSPHSFLHVDEDGKLFIAQSEGNPHTHIVLRGSWDAPNYDPDSVRNSLQRLSFLGKRSRILIDCSHGNCGKNFEKQKEVFHSVMQQIEEGNENIMGVMLESHLESGSQFLSENPSLLEYAVSITDPCIDWSTTEELVREASESRVMRFTHS